MGGMMAATFLAIFFVPMFFKLLIDRRLREHRSTAEIKDEVERTRRFSTRIMRHILTSSLAVLLAACSTQPPYERPQAELPAAWKEVAPRPAEEGRWWRIYRDQELDKVIEEAFAGNADLVITAARVDEARALVAEAESFFFPRVDAQASGRD